MLFAFLNTVSELKLKCEKDIRSNLRLWYILIVNSFERLLRKFYVDKWKYNYHWKLHTIIYMYKHLFPTCSGVKKKISIFFLSLSLILTPSLKPERNSDIENHILLFYPQRRYTPILVSQVVSYVENFQKCIMDDTW